MMKDFLGVYAHNDENAECVINPPATEEQITELEGELELQLPDDYKDFLRATNGFEGWIGDFAVNFEPAQEVAEQTRITCSEFFPWAVFIGSNGNVEMFVIDKRTVPLQFGLLPFIADDNDFILLGNSFEQFLNRLRDGTAFEKL